ncbi:MAG: peptidylprolyl isomerase [Chloroflexi bacterium]|nr:peptidylprolyl isomerase [Chloroflexota bacterium]
MTQPTHIEDDVVVSIQYTLRLDDGELIDEATADDPLIFLQGYGDIIPGLEEALYGMKVGESKEIIVQPEDGYGEYDEDAYELLPHDLFKGVPLEVGLGIELRDKDSEEAYEVFVAEINKEGVLVDFNHPLAGEALTFNVTVVALREPTEEELDHGHVHFEGDEDDEDYDDEDEDDEE